MNNPIVLILFGVLVGVFSGVMGLGGGAIIIPVLVLVFDMTQQAAHGTSLAMILSPTALPAIYRYHSKGFVDWRLVAYVIPGMLLGSYAGAAISTSIPQNALKLVFGFTLVYVAGYTIFGVVGGREHLGRTLVLSGALVLIALAMFATVQWMDRAAGTRTPAVVAPAQEKAHG